MYDSRYGFLIVQCGDGNVLQNLKSEILNFDKTRWPLNIEIYDVCVGINKLIIYGRGLKNECVMRDLNLGFHSLKSCEIVVSVLTHFDVMNWIESGSSLEFLFDKYLVGDKLLFGNDSDEEQNRQSEYKKKFPLAQKAFSAEQFLFSDTITISGVEIVNRDTVLRHIGFPESWFSDISKNRFDTSPTWVYDGLEIRFLGNKIDSWALNFITGGWPGYVPNSPLKFNKNFPRELVASQLNSYKKIYIEQLVPIFKRRPNSKKTCILRASLGERCMVELSFFPPNEGLASITRFENQEVAQSTGQGS